MQNPNCTIICFDYGGYYMKDGAEIKWISGGGEGEDEIHTIVLRKSMEDITYYALVERICRKIRVDESKVQVKISYFPMVLYSYKPSYIWNDEDVFGYLLQVNHEKCRSVLHVEFINEEVQLSEEDDETDSYVGLSDREATEAGDEDGTENDETDVYIGLSDREAIEAGDEDGNGGVLTFHEDIEMHDGVNQRRDDGMDLVIGQEFITKEAAKVLIQAASYQKSFEFDIIKSDTKRFVVKCRGAKDGCNWFVRVAMLKTSNIWTVRSFIKQHTCSVVTRTLPDREVGDEDGTENDATGNEGTGGVLTFHGEIEMGENVTERDEQVFEDTEVRPVVVYQPRDDGTGLVLGQEFRTKEEAKVHIQTASHKKCFEFDITKSDTQRFVVKCRGAKDGCKWFVRVAKLKNTDLWTVRSYIKHHTCSVVTTRTLPNRRKGTSQIVASVLAQDYPGTFDTPVPKVLIDLVHRKVGVHVSYTSAWRGKREAANEVRGSPEESFTLLYCYMHMLEQTNIGTRTRVVVDEANKFKYLFFALGASIEGFSAMRKVLIVDGTHLKNVYGGVLLVATAQDPDHHHYPIAFGVADGENDESWIWFMEQLKSVISDVPGLVFLSDRNKSLIKSVRLVFPEAEHGYCIWHLSQNVKAHVHNNKDTCASKFRDCAHAYTEAEFKYQYHAFRRRYPSAAAYLDKSVEEKKWARCYFRGDRYNVDTTNSVESFNGVIKEARKYTLLPMFDVIIAKMSEWFNNHRKEAAEIPYTLKLVPILETEMSKRCIDAGFLTIDELNSFHLEYSVHGTDGKVYTVDMARNTCSCEQFDKDKYPCVHAVAAATFMSKAAGRELHLSEYCSKYYWVEQWALAYHRTIYPVPHMSDWVIPEDVKAKKILPPDYDKKKGKPQQTRFPSVGESRGRGKRGRGGARGARGRGRARGEDTNTCDHKIVVRGDSFLRRGRENRNRGMGEASAAAELERLQIDILRRISVLESSILPESSSPSLPDDESQTVSRLSAILRSGGVKDISFKRVAPDYYDWPLESRRDVLGASSVDHLCKSIVLVNTQASSDIVDCSDRNNSKYYVVVVQYTARFNAEAVKNFLYSLNEGKIPKKRFNLRLAPEETSIELTGFEHNAVTCVGMKTSIPVILDEAIAKLRPDFFWLGGGEIDLKLGVRTSEFLDFVKPFVVPCS